MIYFWKKCMLSVGLLGIGMVAQADEYGIIISKTNGTMDYVRFSESPKISFSDEDEIVFSANESSLVLRLDEVEDYRFGTVPDNGQSLITDIEMGLDIDFLLTRNKIILRNIEPNDKIRVYSVSGAERIMIKSMEKEIAVDISDLERGTYILTINDTHTFKFCNK